MSWGSITESNMSCNPTILYLQRFWATITKKAHTPKLISWFFSIESLNFNSPVFFFRSAILFIFWFSGLSLSHTLTHNRVKKPFVAFHPSFYHFGRCTNESPQIIVILLTPLLIVTNELMQFLRFFSCCRCCCCHGLVIWKTKAYNTTKKKTQTNLKQFHGKD